jgi:hypothetical protein
VTSNYALERSVKGFGWRASRGPLNADVRRRQRHEHESCRLAVFELLPDLPTSLRMSKAVTQTVNWAGAGPSIIWIAFFIVCMFIRTNLPRTWFATTFLAETRVIWTLAGSFLVMLALSMAISALLARRRKVS